MTMNTFTFETADGYQLAGTFFNRPNDDQKFNHPVLIAPATGIRQGFYRSFAKHLSAQGYDVMSFDFRGIGASLYGDVKNSTASIDDWGVYDLPAAIDALIDKTGSDKVIVIGHSAGAQLLGVAHNHHLVHKLISIAGSTGYVPQLSGRTRLLAPVMFDVIFRLSNTLLGYGATKVIGMGENLPKDVARQWREFCQTGKYIKHSMGTTIDKDYHDDITCPIHAFYAIDDQIATKANVHDFFELFPNASITYHKLIPSDFGLTDIGHMKLFKQSHNVLWQQVMLAMAD